MRGSRLAADVLEEAPGADGDEAEPGDRLERHNFQIARAPAPIQLKHFTASRDMC